MTDSLNQRVTVVLDSNHDNKFNSTDTKWHDLRVWVDANGDAVTEVLYA